MDLDQESIDELRRIYKQEFGEELSDADAREMATRVLTLYELLSRPLPRQEDTRLQK